ncbi:MAG: HAD-IA family hydrolase [Candidatus Marinimicrobia bacterium]|nr:HAD-IA family hydrolase [Candidatus Neomarinimicrobiota bacterium]
MSTIKQPITQPIKLIIFDVDGVLVKGSWPGLFAAYKALIANEGKDYRDFFKDIEEMKKWWNPNWKENEKRIDVKDTEKAHQIFYDVAAKYVHLLSWVKPTLKRLAKKYRMAVLTNRHTQSAMKQIGPVADFFEMIVGADQLQSLKPNPEGVRIILDKLKVRYDDALVIGDMPVDLIAGKKAGTKTGAVIWSDGLGAEEDFNAMDFKPDFIFRSPFCFLRQLF